jgi:hypothetical protein
MPASSTTGLWCILSNAVTAVTAATLVDPWAECKAGLEVAQE